MRIAITTETNQGPLSKVGHHVDRSPCFAFADVIGAEMAGELGLVELKLKLEEMAAEEAGHARELRRVIQGL